MARSKRQPLSRADTLVRAAKFRAKIQAVVRSHPGISTPDIVSECAELMNEEYAPESLVHGQLSALTESGLLTREREGRHMHYRIQGDAPTTTRKAKKQRERSLADVTVDMVKATGRVRLTIGDFVIDIGIAD